MRTILHSQWMTLLAKQDHKSHPSMPAGIFIAAVRRAKRICPGLGARMRSRAGQPLQGCGEPQNFAGEAYEAKMRQEGEPLLPLPQVTAAGGGSVSSEP